MSKLLVLLQSIGNAIMALFTKTISVQTGGYQPNDDGLIGSPPNKGEKIMEIAAALQIVKLVTNVGIPAAKAIFETWTDDEPITAEKIRKYQDKFQDPEDYFGNDFPKE